MPQKEFIVSNGLIVGNSIIHANTSRVGINTSSASVTLDVNSNDAIKIPVGNTTQRPTASNGMIRYNSQTSKAEVYAAGAWVNVVDNRIFVQANGIATGGGNLSSNVVITVPEANVTQFYAATGDLVIAPDVAWASANLVSLSDGATIAVNCATGYNFTVTLGGNRTLGNPTNTKDGATGVIVVKQDGTGNRTLSYSSNWKFVDAEAPEVTASANKVAVLSYFIVNSTYIFAALSANTG